MEGVIEQQPISADLDSVMDEDIIILDPAASFLEKLPPAVKPVAATVPAPPPKSPLEFPDVSGYKYPEKVPCPHCRKIFKAGYLHEHILIHSDIKPYGCSYCFYHSRWPGDVKLHEQKWCKLRSKPAWKVKAHEKKRDLAGLECNVEHIGKKRPKGKKFPSKQAAKSKELMQTAAYVLQRDPESGSPESVQSGSKATMEQHVQVAVGGDDENQVLVHGKLQELDLENLLQACEASEEKEHVAPQSQYVVLPRAVPGVTPKELNSIPENPAATSPDLQQASPEENLTFAPGRSPSALQQGRQLLPVEEYSSAMAQEYTFAFMLCNFMGTTLESASVHAATHNIRKTPDQISLNLPF